MCGISGILSTKQPPLVDELRSMTSSLRHRGPDDEGIFVDGCIGLGHNRLSIIDLSSRGHQPMFNESGSLCIVFNGEIYNFKALRGDLLKKGVSFRSNSDTEVVLALYQEYGPDCLAKLNGMFALAIWDVKRKSLFLARDRLGKKPVYYYGSENQLAFASEIQALTGLQWVPRKLDQLSLRQYLLLQYIPGPRTIYDGIYRLLPGQSLIAEVKNNRINIVLKDYWRCAQPGTSHFSSAEEVSEKTEALLRESVKLRLVSDVEVGILLSGGLDSSLLVALAAQETGSTLKTFSVRFDDEAIDESDFASLVAKKFGTDHFTLKADTVTSDLILEIFNHLDEPLADPACIPTYMISSFASNHVKVVLSGEGADEIFGGYPFYLHEIVAGPFLSMPKLFRKLVSGPLATLAIPFLGPNRSTRLRKVFSNDTMCGSVRWTSVFEQYEQDSILSPDVPHSEIDWPSFLKKITDMSGYTPLERAMSLDLRMWLPDDLLMKVDKMTMAHSLEARNPYLDYRLVEYVAGLSGDIKIPRFKTKAILKNIAKDVLPGNILNRKKHGFEVPLLSWMRNNLRDICEESFSRDHLRNVGIFDAREVEKLWSAAKKNPRSVNARKLWTIFCFSLWMEQHHIQLA